MASYSDVKTGLDAVAVVIHNQRVLLGQSKAQAATASAALASLVDVYADVIATVNAYGTANAAEAVAKADLAKLTSEFQALKSVADAIAAANLG